ncbi:TldD/PmbA family protein [Methylocystis heyeri]|uniref:TldD/PmbA family protein n=1 Tax=Methylocystis heyeri TaxID=391905 RepID=UPI00113961EC|nr:metallopeptidase TldD-related protein [Methylocystis heyeri]
MTSLQNASLDDFSAELVARALARGASAAQARASDDRYFEMQFDNRGYDLVRSVQNAAASITVFLDGKRGDASLNGRSTEEVAAALDSAFFAAEAGVADEANDVAAAPSLPASRHGLDIADRATMGEGVESLLARLRSEFPLVRIRDSLHSFSDVETAFANSRGVAQKERRARYNFSALFMAREGSRASSVNWAEASSYQPFGNPFHALGLGRLLDEAVRSLDPRPVPCKFEGDVIITPECFAGLAGSIGEALSGASLFAGTTPFVDKKGEMIASPLFSLANRPCDKSAPGGADFDGFGVPTSDLEIVTNGRLNDFLIDYFFSRKLKAPQTAGAWRFTVTSGDASLAAMIAGVKRGILFSRFSGGGPNSNLDFTGVAKNSFYIEDGEIRHALGETMVSGNFQELLKNIYAVSRERVDFGSASYPWLAASGVVISSK